ncbi:GGDEF domain-containing protein [Clostridium sp. UBA4548]|uniref:GGDEF domain-containing protein n=1 Tax=Clostridium sp. UBA4548 TaxID=1946361 RepID=UPI0025C3504F|nr:GGDEF domain-containing protein [Clostridium sp. UBA4548]
MRNNKYVQYAPLIFATFGLFFAIAGYFITFYTPRNIAKFTWLALMFVFIVVGLKFGRLVRSFYADFYKDSLTGLKNRFFFYLKLDCIMDKISTVPEPLTLLMIDIDNFKHINDTFGHVNGDKILKTTAEILNSSVRGNDVVARWGGEEFTILLPSTDINKATIIGERIRETISTHPFKIDDVSLTITVSVGICSTTKKIDAEEFVNLADCALYKAKEKKNKVVNCEQLVAV